MTRRVRGRMSVFTVALLIAGVVHGQAAEDSLQFPALWLNSPPVSPEQLKGKLVVLYFFEEDCPRCREAWPDKLDLAKKYADKPVVFIGVNSGTQPDKLQTYLRETGVNWPTIVDVDRSLERFAKVGEISLQNISQLSVITPQGELQRGSWSDWEGTIERYISDAKWRIDPTEIPAALKPIWQNVELGNFGAALSALAKSKKFKDEKSQAAIEKLNGAITDEFNEQLAAAKSAEEAGNKWGAYQRYHAMTVMFKSLPDAKEVKDAEKKLAADTAVAREIKAATMLAKATQSKGSSSAAGEKRRTAALQAIVKDYADTAAGKQAQELLASP